MSRRMQWSDLHSELLHIIFQKLKDPFDIYRCRAVCVSWKSVATTVLSSSPPQYLFLSNVFHGVSCPLFNVKTNETQGTILPELEGRWISSSTFGWLLTIGFNKRKHNVRLWNPYTRDQIELPPTKHMKKSNELRVITSTSPLDRNCLVLATLNGGCELAFCRPGDMFWTKIKCSRRNFTSFGLKTIFYQDKFYAVDFDANLYRIFCNIPCAKKLCVRPADNLPGTSRYYNYLVELGGELLMVARFASLFRVYKLNWVEKRWIEMESIGSNAILLYKSSSLSLHTDCSTYFKTNCIYFLEHTRKHERKVSLYNLETKKIKCHVLQSSFI